jgi:hypothetical protein
MVAFGGEADTRDIAALVDNDENDPELTAASTKHKCPEASSNRLI